MKHTIRLKSGQSIVDALALQPMDCPLHIIFEEGIWFEKVLVGRADVTFEADTPGTAIISCSDHNGMMREGKVLGTGDSATCTVAAPRFSAIGMIFTNDFDYLKQKEGDPAKRHGTQAVAFRTAEGAIDTTCERCTFIGWQDTLFCDVGTHLFQHCRIMGNIDFIFGAGIAFFDHCTVISRYSGNEGYICAPSTKLSQQLGFCFYKCSLEKDSFQMPEKTVWLGRPWHPGGATDVYCAAVYIECEMDNHVIDGGWTSMHSRTKEGVERTWYPDESRFAEYDSHGPGAHGIGEYRRLLTDSQASNLVREFRKAIRRAEHQ